MIFTIKQFVANAYKKTSIELFVIAFFVIMCSVSLVIQGSRHRVNEKDIQEAGPKNGNTV